MLSRLTISIYYIMKGGSVVEPQEYIQHWNYYCSLAARFDGTKEYVYHGFRQNEGGSFILIHGDVYSDIFKQIIILSASEFEIIAKAICQIKGQKAENIKCITNILLKHFPNLPKTEIMTPFFTGTPLQDWRVEDGKVVGLDWWRAYNSLKHNEIDSYRKATLENAFLSIATLYILNLYLMYVFSGSLAMAYNLPPVYFRCKYTPYSVNSGEGSLPDWGNKSPFEKAVEKYPELSELQ